jgi:pilus assembly protein CpaE
MVSRIKILVASRSEAAANAVTAKLRMHGRFNVNTRVVVNGHTDPLHDVHPRPDVLVLHYVPGYGELEYLAMLNPNQRARLLVFGPAGDADAMRLAMRAGASDYLPEPLTETDLLHSLDRLCEELSQKAGNSGKLLTVVNSKGGSGASFVATNLACVLAKDESRRTTLMDLDLQFGGLARYLDLAPERGVVEALDAISEMDQAAAEAFVTVHGSGLKLLAAPSDRLIQQVHVSPEQVDMLLQVFLQNNDYVVADLPRQIDGLSTTVLERSDRILLIVQQSLAHINGAAKLLHVITGELGMSRDLVEVVVNRFEKKSVIELDDVRKTLRVDHVHVIPNQYKLVSESIDTGNPATQSAKGSAVAKALRELATRVSGSDRDETRRSGFLGRTLPNLLGAH